MASSAETNNLMSLAGDTLAKLGEIWNEVGLSGDERKAQLQQLEQDVAYVYNDRLKMEVEHRDTLRARILSATDRTNRYAISLGRPLLSENLADAPTLKEKFERITLLSADIEKAYEDRVGQLEDLHKRLHDLWEALGVSGERDVSGQFSNPPEDLSETHLIRCHETIHQTSLEVEERRVEISHLVAEIRDIWDALGTTSNSHDDLDTQIESGELSLSSACINSLRERRDHLVTIHHEREDVIKGLAVQILGLWNMLGVADEERATFLERNAGLSDDVLEECRCELSRLENLKRESMKAIIMKARAEIEALWEELHVFEADRDAFRRQRYTLDYDDQVLNGLHSYIKYLDERAQIVRPILKQIHKREEILKEKIDFEATSSDPARLLSKKRDPGRLLREEKMRNMITKELPKIEATLRAALVKWNAENEVAFEYDGRDYLQVLGEEKVVEKQKKSVSQANASESLSKSRIISSTTTTPSKPSAPGSVSRSNLNKTVNLTPSKTPKAATVGPSSGRAVRKNVPQPMSLGHSSAIKLNSTLPSQMEAKRLFDTSIVSPISSTKKRPFSVANVNNSPAKEVQDRALKSLKNLGVGSPGGSENTPLASRLASPAKKTPARTVCGRT